MNVILNLNSQERTKLNNMALVQWIKNIPKQLSPNCGPLFTEKLLGTIIHYTAGGSTGGTVKWLCDPIAKASAHFVIGRGGHIVQLVPLDTQAWHAGVSEWPPQPPLKDGRKGCNRFTLGIELCNKGVVVRDKSGKFCSELGGQLVEYKGSPPSLLHNEWWEPYPSPQLNSLTSLLKQLKFEAPEGCVDKLLGHEEIAPGRKRDPGPAFPWERFRG